MKEDKEGAVKEEGEVVGHLEATMKTKIKMKMRVLAGTRGMRVSTAPMTKTLKIREEEVEDMDKEEEASMVPVSIVMKKVIMPLNVLNDKEGQIGELRAKLGLLMWMKMHNHHIQRMQKEERPW